MSWPHSITLNSSFAVECIRNCQRACRGLTRLHCTHSAPTVGSDSPARAQLRPQLLQRTAQLALFQRNLGVNMRRLHSAGPRQHPHLRRNPRLSRRAFVLAAAQADSHGAQESSAGDAGAPASQQRRGVLAGACC